ncbi:DUF2922 domain-containing protein [Terrilactibacillus sp. S3-3]|nr:DUF2922 domain-containing protein [Terrilactibacillus sp. S3-3]
MKSLDLIFLNQQGKSVTLSLADPAEPYNPVAIKQAMDEIVTQNVFTSTGGDLVAVKSARVSERTTTDIALS